MMRRVLVVLLGLGLAELSGAAGRDWPPVPAAAPSLIDDHEFEPWRYASGLVVCMYFDSEHPTRGMCDRPAEEHARVPEGSEVGGDPLQDGEGVGADGGQVEA
jgi:hypothetical protein